MDVLLPPQLRLCPGCGRPRSLRATRFGPIFKCVGPLGHTTHVEEENGVDATDVDAPRAEDTNAQWCPAPPLRYYEVLRAHRERCRDPDECASGTVPLLTDKADSTTFTASAATDATQQGGASGQDTEPTASNNTRSPQPYGRYGLEPRRRLSIELLPAADVDDALEASEIGRPLSRACVAVVDCADPMVGADLAATLAATGLTPLRRGVDGDGGGTPWPRAVSSALEAGYAGPYAGADTSSLVRCARELTREGNERAAVAPSNARDATSAEFVSLSLPPPPTAAFYGLDPTTFRPCDSLNNRSHNGGGSGGDLPRQVEAALAPGGVLEHTPLRAHQRKSLRFIAGTAEGRALLADEMGTGKTLTSLAAMAAFGAVEESLLIVTPASSRAHWADEVERWLKLDPRAIAVVWDSNSKPPDPAAAAATPTPNTPRSRSRSTPARRRSPPGSHTSTQPPSGADEPNDDGEDTLEDTLEASAADDADGGDEAPDIPLDARVVITSYNMAVRLRGTLLARRWRGLIADESHILRSPSFKVIHGRTADEASSTTQSQAPRAPMAPTEGAGQSVTAASQRLDTLAQLARAAPLVLLLSGTPSAVRAVDLWDQVSMLRPGLLGPSLADFAVRYATLTFIPHMQCGRCHRHREVGAMLRRSVMTRVTKREALPSLPPKVRSVCRVVMDLAAAAPRAASSAADADDEITGAEAVDEDDCGGDEANNGGSASTPAARAMTKSFQAKYHATGRAKQDSAAAMILAKLQQLRAAASQAAEAPSAALPHEAGYTPGAGPPGVATTVVKLVVFAHHVSVLDALACRLAAARVNYVRIDGAVSGTLRQQRITAFNKDPMCELALLGVTACGVGIALPAASTCVFAELPPDASWLQQAEDRLHRPGQRGACVESILCVGIGSAFDAKHVARLTVNLAAIRDVVDPVSTTAAAMAATSSGPSQQQQQQQQQQEVAARLDALAACTELYVSRHSGRIHGLVAGAPRARCSAHRDEIEAVLLAASIAADNGTEAAEPVNRRAEQLKAVAAFADLYASLPAATRRAVQVAGPMSLFHLRNRVSQLPGHHSGSTRRFRPRWPTPADGFTALPNGCVCFAWVVRAPAAAGASAIDAFVEPAVGPAAAQRPARSPLPLSPGGSRIQSPVAARQPRRIAAIPSAPPSPAVSRRASPSQRNGGAAHAPPSAWCMGLLRLCSSNADGHGHRWELLCPHCCDPRPPGQLSATMRRCLTPGAHVVLAADAPLFCSGTCRGDFWTARSGRTARALLEAADGGVCAGCGVDCRALTDRVATAPTVEERLEIIRDEHPGLAAEPALAAALARHPVQGNAWHADHVVPVAHGGGEASLLNLQTLCVACHRVKTRLEHHPRRARPT